MGNGGPACVQWPTVKPSPTMLERFREDVRQYFVSIDSRSKSDVLASIFEMSLWAIAIFRFGKWAQSLRFRLVRWPLMAFYFFLYKVSQALSGIRISLDSEIAPGLVIHNFGGVVIHGQIGKNCIFVQGAQMISRADGKGRGWPTLGDHVYVGAGAKLVGNVMVGNNSRIGANAVVMTDVPENSVVMPPESRILRDFRPGVAAPPVEIASSLRQRVLHLLEETLCQGGKFPLDDSASLLESGLIDSLKILQLADFLSEKFGIVVAQDDLTPENLDSVAGLVGYLRGKGVSDQP